LCQSKNAFDSRVGRNLREGEIVFGTPLLECHAQQRDAALGGNSCCCAALRNQCDVLAFQCVTPSRVQPRNDGNDLLVVSVKPTRTLLGLIIINETANVCRKWLGARLGRLLLLSGGLAKGRMNHAHELEKSQVTVTICARNRVRKSGAGALENVISRQEGMQRGRHNTDSVHHGGRKTVNGPGGSHVRSLGKRLPRRRVNATYKTSRVQDIVPTLEVGE
jgi:hypothetical protein